MSQQGLFETIPHENHFLFSDHYLDNILPRLEAWNRIEEIAEIQEKLRKLYLKVGKGLAASNEAQLERDFVQPILRILGHAYEVQASLQGTGELIRPDYTFFRNEEERLAAKELHGKKEYFEKALAIGDAKSWDRPLDRKIKKRRDVEDIRNPSVQINNYLLGSGKKWGILSNGRLWRLYNRDTSFSLDSYYQIDLVKLIEQDNPDAFKYFYLFFRRQAFEPYDSKLTFLDFIYDQSTSYKVELSQDVKNRVYEALRILANGFLKYPKNRFESVKDQEVIHNNCLIFLYRLLFVFFAEARGLMPDHSDYQTNFSFDILKKQIRQRKQRGEAFSPITTEVWCKLQALFMLINDPRGLYNMPQYNGGLFNSDKHSFLEENRIGDEAMTDAFDLIACAETKDGFGFVDYRTLDVQHLGSIYEGLLEYKLEVANPHEVIVKGTTGHFDFPVAYQAGEYYLVTNKGERKATGSYYTPDYIVRYIVENTLKPLVKQCRSYQEILDLKVLDPAMGSGHFLVGVVDFLAEQLAYFQDAPLMAEGTEESEMAYWRRRVVERCVYGVDINPLAVELAKLSLWLHTVSYGKPLSFLDHHLRCGNSLIGAWVNELHELPDARAKKKVLSKGTGKQITLFEKFFRQRVSLAVGHYLLIEQMETHSKHDIEKKEELLKIAEEHLRQFKELAHVWASFYFGNVLSKDDYLLLLEALQDNRFDKVRNLPFFKRAQELAQAKHFFHWEIEFPAVFFDKFGRWLDNPGFDGVVGNPPWGSEVEKPVELMYELAHGQYDSWNLFTENSLKLTKISHGFVIPDSILFPEHERTRKYLKENSHICSVIRLGEGSFPDIYRAAFVYIISKLHPSDTIKALQLFKNDRSALESGDFRGLENLMEIRGTHFPVNWMSSEHDYEFGIGLSKKDMDLITKLEDGAINWEDYFDDSRGVELGKNGAVIRCPQCRLWIPKPIDISKKHCPNCGSTFKRESLLEEKIISESALNQNYLPFLGGEDVNRYYFVRHSFIDTSYDGINYKDLNLYKKPKLLVRKTGVGIYANIDYKHSLCNQVVFIFWKKASDKPVDFLSLEYLLGLLNSQVMLYYYIQRFGEKEWRSFPYVTQRILKKLPIKNPSSSQKLQAVAKEIATLVKKVVKADGPISKSLDLEVEDLVTKIYGLTKNETEHIQKTLKSMQRLRIIREVGL